MTHVNTPWFSDRDLEIIEALEYDPDEAPGFEVIKACLIWPDERPFGVTPEGYDLLSDLWTFRGYAHRGIPYESWPFDPTDYRALWETAVAKNLRWPGLRRLNLSDRDRQYLEACLADPEPL